MKNLVFILFFLIGLGDAVSQNYCHPERFRDTVYSIDEIEILSDIEYANTIDWKGNEKQLLLDIRQPLPSLDTLSQRPCIIFVHGGGFSGGSKDTENLVYILETLTRMGYVTVGINYRLGWDKIAECGGDTASLFKAQYRAVQDARSAIRYVKEFAADYRIDTNMLILAGFSAGANTALKSLYAQQSDFPDYLWQELGSIDSSGNEYYDHTTMVKSLMLKAPGLESTQFLADKTIPTLFIHGTCDIVAPYFSGPLYSCYTPITYPTIYGSRYMSDLMLVQGVPYHLHTIEGGDHGDPDDTIVLGFMKQFLVELVCDQLETREIYRFNSGGCLIESESQLDVNIAPNPVQDMLSLTITSGFEGVYEIRIFSIQGQLMHYSEAEFEPPMRKFGIDIGSTPMSRGMYFLEVRSRNYNGVYTFFKE